MTIDKAIEILTARVESPFVRANQNTKDAIRLGIEALKWRLHCEKVNLPTKYALLPGETEK